MAGWIKWDKNLETSPRVIRMVAALRREHERDDRHATVTLSSGMGAPWITLVCGGLVRFWVYADSHIRQDDTLDLGFDEIDELVGIPGFARCMPKDWIEPLDDGRVKLPGFQQHNGVIARKKAKDAERAKRYRARKSAERVTHTVTPKRDAVTKKRDEDLDLDLDHINKISSKSLGDAKPPPDPFDTKFAEFKAAYPKRDGDHRWPTAKKHIRARLREGHTWDEIIAGTKRYAEWVRETGKERTEHVKQGASFVGTDKGFLEAWDLPTPQPKGSEEAALRAARDRRNVTDLAKLLRIEQHDGEDWTAFRARVIAANERRIARQRGGGVA